jgi:tetratricopeptide (TPR) repeat protein
VTAIAGPNRQASFSRAPWAALALALLGLLHSPARVLALSEKDQLIQSAKQQFEEGDYEGAEDTLQQAVERQDAGSAKYAVCLQNMALIKYMNFHFIDAENLYLKALPITESCNGADSMAAANNMYGLIRCLRRMNCYAEAEPYLKKILTIRTKQLGPNNKLVTNSLLDLAVNSSRQNKHEEALYYSSRAVQERETAVGKDSPFMIQPLVVYATLLRPLNASQASEIDARIEHLRSSSQEFVDTSKKEEDGSSWQTVTEK